MEETSSNYQKAWSLCLKVFPILSGDPQDTIFSKTEFEELCSFMRVHRLQDLVQQLVVNGIEKRLRSVTVPEFWSGFQKTPKPPMHFYHSVRGLYDNYRQLEWVMSRLEVFAKACDIAEVPYNESNWGSALKLILKANLFAQLDVDYQSTTMEFYEAALRMEDLDEGCLECLVCQQDQTCCNCLHLFQETNRLVGL